MESVLMKRPEWMDTTEKPLGSWAVFIGEDGPRTEKIAGRLYVTSLVPLTKKARLRVPLYDPLSLL
jgi:hypothetical protein